MIRRREEGELRVGTHWPNFLLPLPDGAKYDPWARIRPLVTPVPERASLEAVVASRIPTSAGGRDSLPRNALMEEPPVRVQDGIGGET